MTPDELVIIREEIGNGLLPVAAKTLLAALEEATNLVDDLRDGITQMGEYHNDASWERLAKRRLPWEAPQSSQEPAEQA